ncbi:MAG: hypothetical protein IJK26_05385 [Clostridia bacterium]|nr:hypothetical protein [Clostridia bacterium]
MPFNAQPTAHLLAFAFGLLLEKCYSFGACYTAHINSVLSENGVPKYFSFLKRI